MSQIESIRRFSFLLLMGLVAFTGCGTPVENAAFDPDAGQHLANWMVADHVAAAKADSGSCTECHGSDLSGGISEVACAECHLSGSPLTKTNCTSCHGKPPAGAVAPNRMGAHWAHSTLPTNVNICDSCHSGAGTGSKKHFDGVTDVKMLSVFSAKSGTAVKNADGTCSNVSCHGGQKAPAWSSGAAIDVNTQCTLCHEFGTTQYNSYSSGRHDTHAGVYAFPCVRCHDAALLQAEHFSALNTTAVEGNAANTMDSSLQYISGTCLPACHNRRPW